MADEALNIDYRAELADWFAADDGSLPELRITGLAEDEAASLGQYLRRLSSTSTSTSPDQVHRVVSFEIDGCLIPEIGIGLFDQTSIVLDWRMGPEWDSTAILTFLRFVRDLIDRCATASLQLEAGTTDVAREHFRRIFAQVARSGRAAERGEF